MSRGFWTLQLSEVQRRILGNSEARLASHFGRELRHRQFQSPSPHLIPIYLYDISHPNKLKNGEIATMDFFQPPVFWFTTSGKYEIQTRRVAKSHHSGCCWSLSSLSCVEIVLLEIQIALQNVSAKKKNALGKVSLNKNIKPVVSTHLKNISQNGNLPQIGVKLKNIWRHHLEYDLVIFVVQFPSFTTWIILVGSCVCSRFFFIVWKIVPTTAIHGTNGIFTDPMTRWFLWQVRNIIPYPVPWRLWVLIPLP